MEGIEPSTQAWEAHVLPLNYIRAELVGGMGRQGWLGGQAESGWRRVIRISRSRPWRDFPWALISVGVISGWGPFLPG